MRGPKLSVYPKGALLETYRRRLIALREDGYNDDFMAALEEVHRHLEKHDAALGTAPQPAAAREHTASADCWCNPTIDYVDPETGSAVYVHHEPN